MVFNYLCIMLNNIYSSVLLFFNICNCFYKKNNSIESNKEKKLIKNIQYNKINELKMLFICNYCKKEIKNEIYNIYDNHYCSNKCRSQFLKKI